MGQKDPKMMVKKSPKMMVKKAFDEVKNSHKMAMKSTLFVWRSGQKSPQKSAADYRKI
jgi:hypothetical protein